MVGMLCVSYTDGHLVCLDSGWSLRREMGAGKGAPAFEKDAWRGYFLRR